MYWRLENTNTAHTEYIGYTGYQYIHTLDTLDIRIYLHWIHRIPEYTYTGYTEYQNKHTLDTLDIRICIHWIHMDTIDTLVIRIYIQWISAKYQCIFLSKISMYACMYKNVGVCVCINVCVQTHILYLSVENHLENLWQPSSWYRQTNKQTNLETPN